MLRWEPPSHLPDYQTINYKLQYWPVEFEEEKVEEILGDVHNYELTGLPMNTMFAAKVKVFQNYSNLFLHDDSMSVFL